MIVALSRLRALPALLGVMLTGWCATAAWGQSFIDLGLPGEATRSEATSINDSGLIAINTNTQAWLRAPDGTYMPAGLPPGFTSGSIRRLNDVGEAAASVGSEATIRYTDGSYLRLFPGQTGYAAGINDAGEVTCGTSSPYTAWLYQPGAGLNQLTFPAGTTSPTAIAINNSGVIAGTATPPGSTFFKGFRYSSASGYQLLPTPPDQASEVTDVNDDGIIVGVIGGGGGLFRAVKWLADNTVVELGAPPGLGFLAANAINSTGDIVGSALAGGGAAVLWSSDFGNIDLNMLLTPEQRFHWSLYRANDINDQRQIVGVGRFDPDGPGPLAAMNRAFLLNLPEPALSIVPLLLCLTLARHRRAR